MAIRSFLFQSLMKQRKQVRPRDQLRNIGEQVSRFSSKHEIDDERFKTKIPTSIVDRKMKRKQKRKELKERKSSNYRKSIITLSKQDTPSPVIPQTSTKKPKQVKPKSILKTAKRNSARDEDIDALGIISQKERMKAEIEQGQQEISKLAKKLKIKSGKVPKSFYEEGDMGFFHDICDMKFDKNPGMEDLDQTSEADSTDGAEVTGSDMDMNEEIDSDCVDSDDDCAPADVDECSEDEIDEVPVRKKARMQSDVKFVENKTDLALTPARSHDKADPYGGASRFYVPPQKRIQLAEVQSSLDTEASMKAYRECIGLLNRVSESNLSGICKHIEAVYSKNGVSETNNALSKAVLNLCVASYSICDRLLFEKVAVIAVLHKNTQTDIGASFLHQLVWKWEKTRNQESVNNDSIVSDKTLINCVYCFCYSYIFKICTSKLIFTIIRQLLDSFSLQDVECLLVFLHNAGLSLRKESIVDLKDIILSIIRQGNERLSSFDENQKQRVVYFLDVVAALKNNNTKKFLSGVDSTALENIEQTVKNSATKQLADGGSQLNVDLCDIINAGENGRWWNLGTDAGVLSSQKSSQAASSTKIDDDIVALAHQHKMNTPFREGLFCAIMTSSDYMEAFEKILRMNLKKNLRDVPYVIIRCCLLEKTYNMFYFYLLKQFGAYEKQHSIILKFAIADKLREIASLEKSQVINFSRLVADLIIVKAVQFLVLDILDMSELTSNDTIFFRRCICRVICADSQRLSDILETVQKSEAGERFLKNLDLFISHHVTKKMDKLPADINSTSFKKGYKFFREQINL